jgi:hypothetical protein
MMPIFILLFVMHIVFSNSWASIIILVSEIFVCMKAMELISGYMDFLCVLNSLYC